MATATQIPKKSSVVDDLIKPAISRLVSESEGAYRCERDLHHHFTVCLQHVMSLELGTHGRRVRMEEPAFACYGSGRKGNLDYFFPRKSTRELKGALCDGVAVELNFNYRDGYKKIRQDIQKLIDPANAYQESLYFAYCKKRNFFEAVTQGIERAFREFEEAREDFRLPAGLHVIIVEYVRNGNHIIREASVEVPCLPSDLQWVETTVPRPPAEPIHLLVTDVDSDRTEDAHSNISGGDCPYMLNTDFNRDELEELLKIFESAVRRQQDRSLSQKLRRELLESGHPFVSSGATKQLAKWCNTNNPLYWDGMDVARKISQLLFGCVLDRVKLHV
jgi:hypothetical protein